MQITVTIKSNYGNEAIYPACKNAELFTSLTRKKTLSRFDIDYIKQLGYTVNIITAQPVTL